MSSLPPGPGPIMPLPPLTRKPKSSLSPSASGLTTISRPFTSFFVHHLNSFLGQLTIGKLQDANASRLTIWTFIKLYIRNLPNFFFKQILHLLPLDVPRQVRQIYPPVNRSSRVTADATSGRSVSEPRHLGMHNFDFS